MEAIKQQNVPKMFAYNFWDGACVPYVSFDSASTWNCQNGNEANSDTREFYWADAGWPPSPPSPPEAVCAHLGYTELERG